MSRIKSSLLAAGLAATIAGAGVYHFSATHAATAATNGIAVWLNEQNQASDNVFWIPRIWRGGDVPIFLSKALDAKTFRVDLAAVSAVVIMNIDVGLVEIAMFDGDGKKLEEGSTMPSMVIGKMLNRVRDEIIAETGNPPDLSLKDCVYASVSCHVLKQAMGAGGLVYRSKL